MHLTPEEIKLIMDALNTVTFSVNRQQAIDISLMIDSIEGKLQDVDEEDKETHTDNGIVDNLAVVGIPITSD